MDHQPVDGGLSAMLQQLYSVPAKQVRASSQLQKLRASDTDKGLILSSIPSTSRPSHRPLHLLYVLLTEIDGPWPAFPVIRCHTRLSKLIPDDTRANPNKHYAALIKTTAKLVKASYGSLSDFLGQEPVPALRAAGSGAAITHRGLHHFVTNFQLPAQQGLRKPVVAIALPNGPLLAATCMAVTTSYTAAPINQSAGAEQFRADVLQAGASFILTTGEDCERLKLGESWVADKGIQVFIVAWDSGDGISLLTMAGEPQPQLQLGRNEKPNKADDIGLILFTSGTSGTKKVVPLTMHSIIAGIIFVVDSWGLTPADICLNMMPLYHVGGLVRNVFAPMFSGGSTVCCSAFDPNTFWDVVQDAQPTWYYASPSMHSVILAEASARPESLQRSRIRLACNAAGGLLPSLACQLRDTFNCVVLPSYGMTECMPISTPPLDYRLDREGTSGISTGPGLAILDWSEAAAQPGTVGRICVRGEPVFPGYLLPDGSLDKSPFNAEGWFDTGDLGYMDDDGYLYITGRSKEVINRGGELISPFEVENAIMTAAMSANSPISGRVSQALAFSACHDVLQEVVAVVLVTPPRAARVDLKSLHDALRSSLQQAKWPVLVAYMDDVPKKNNKVLRIKLGQRLSLPDVTDDMAYLSRHWQAVCPPPDTALSVAIDCSPCPIDWDAISACLDAVTPPETMFHCRRQHMDGTVEAFLAPAEPGSKAPKPQLKAELRQRVANSLHNYMIPHRIHLMPEPLPRDPSGSGAVDEAELELALEQMLGESLGKLEESTEGRVTGAFADILSCSPSDVPRDVDFFSLGGDSLRAGRLVSALRSNFGLPLPISIVFNQGTVSALAAHIDQMAKTSGTGEAGGAESGVAGCSETNSSTNPLLMLVQLIPLAILYPMRRAFQWTVFIVALGYTQTLPTNGYVAGRLLNVLACITLSRAIIRCVAPLLGIAAKWLIIGRYRPGLYPMWGMYHTRWWMVQKIVSICGKGFFNMNDRTKRLYCRLMGAKVGKNVKLAGVALGEWDLLDFREGATLTRCICRPFAVEGNTTMYLGRIVIGENCSVGTASIVAPGTTLPANTCIGPNSSSWELHDADEANRDLSPGRAPKPHWLLTCLLTVPLSFLAWVVSLLPWAGGLVGMVLDQPLSNQTPLRDILDWFTAAERVGFHYLALVLRCFFSPFIFFAFAVAVKLALDATLGRHVSGPAEGRGAMAVWRATVIKALLPVSRLHEMTTMFGQHYDATSAALRMLGAKVGKRVYWPGTGPSIGDYHLLDIGNDVVFGSRAHLVTSDGTGSAKITVRDRAMIADRVCLLPGVEVGERAIMGSGALTRRGKAYSAEGTFVGSKGGDAVCLSAGREPSREKLQRSGDKPSRSPPHKPGQMQHMSSDETLAGDRRPHEKQSSRSRIQHMSSDDTLADTRALSPVLRRYQSSRPDSLTTSGSWADDGGEGNDAAELSSTDSVTPFGRAFYLKLAPYHVLGPFAIFCYSSFITVFTSFYWNVPNISSIQLVDIVMNRFIPRDINLWVNVAALYLMTAVTIAILTTLQAVFSLAIVVAAKWALLGRRTPGNYDWDKSSYCQRWQLFLCVEKIRRYCYRGQGVLGLLTGTSWIVLYFRALGANIGKDCALFANGRPNLMFTEPDLITLGDRVAVDDASVVGHINTRGKFDLNRLEIGNRCVLRTGSRLLSGATMKDDSCLLEHTLIMGGDVVEARWTMQGWPAENFIGQRVLE